VPSDECGQIRVGAAELTSTPEALAKKLALEITCAPRRFGSGLKFGHFIELLFHRVERQRPAGPSPVIASMRPAPRPRAARAGGVVLWFAEGSTRPTTNDRAHSGIAVWRRSMRVRLG